MSGYPMVVRGVAQPGSARRSGGRGLRFKSGHPDRFATMSGMRRTGVALGIVAGAAVLLPGRGAGPHAGSEIDYRFPLPVWLYALAAGLAVLLSAPAASFAERSTGSRTTRDFYRFVRPAHLGLIGTAVLSLVLVDVLVGGFGGPDDFFENPATLVIWVDFWVGLGVVSALIGNAWDFISPL